MNASKTFSARAIGGLIGWLMLPYNLWVSFATVLNGAIWLMNYKM